MFMLGQSRINLQLVKIPQPGELTAAEGAAHQEETCFQLVRVTPEEKKELKINRKVGLPSNNKSEMNPKNVHFARKVFLSKDILFQTRSKYNQKKKNKWVTQSSSSCFPTTAKEFFSFKTINSFKDTQNRAFYYTLRKLW